MAEGWRLPKNDRPGKIGESTGSFEDYFRILQSKTEAYEIRCVTGPFSETVLVYNPIAQTINGTFIYACVVLWKDYKTHKESTEVVLIGDFDEFAIRYDNKYFDLMMKDFLSKERIKKYMNQNPVPQNLCNNYIGRIKRSNHNDSNEPWIKEYNPDLAMACAESEELSASATALLRAINEHQQKYEQLQRQPSAHRL